MLCKIGCEEICNASMWMNTISSIIVAFAVGYIIWDKFVKPNKPRGN